MMDFPIGVSLEKLEQLIEAAGVVRSRLILLARLGGKTRFLHELGKRLGIRPLNLGVELGKRLAAMPVDERAFSAGEVLRGIAAGSREEELLPLDNLDRVKQAFWTASIFGDFRVQAQRRAGEPLQEKRHAGFRAAWAAKDCGAILAIARKLPDETLQEDEKLLALYGMALMRSEAGS
jgi:hypothetical protein